MAGGRGHRKIAVDKEKAKEVKKLLSVAKNSIEIKRINIVCVYLGGADMERTAEILGSGVNTICKTISSYAKDPENFYKTSYKGRIETVERKELKGAIREYIEKQIEKEENIDINEVLRVMNKKQNKEVTTYNGMWWVIRKHFQYNYQKPFVTNKKEPEHAEQIIKGRLTKAILKVATEEKCIDAGAIKNKKNKITGIFR